MKKVTSERRIARPGFVTGRLPEGLIERFEQIARSRKVTRTALLEEAIRDKIAQDDYVRSQVERDRDVLRQLDLEDVFEDVCDEVTA